MSWSIERCQEPSCRREIDLDWDAVACPCGAVVTCEGCEPEEVCDVCRAKRDEREAS